MTDAISWKEKEDAWKSITNVFNSNSIVFREMHSLKKFYEKKKNTCKIIAHNRSEVYKTGGGKIEAPAISTINIATLEIMNATSVNGHNNDYDDDQVTITNDIILSNIQYEYEESDISNNEISIAKINTHNQIPKEVVDWSANNMCASNL
ncbi:hypothetical protein QTP88_020392 [Uroleucon formosanum]